MSTSSTRVSTASAPCAGAGSIWMGSSVSVINPIRSVRAKPARANTMASSSPDSTMPSRLSMLPRIGTTFSPSPSARSWVIRRGEPVPTVDPGGNSPRVSPSRATSASRGSSRFDTAASAMPGSGAVGRSLKECTAMSTLPSSNAWRTADVNTPTPISAIGADDWSPGVATGTSSTLHPAFSSILAIVPVWAIASLLPRVPMRMVLPTFVPAVSVTVVHRRSVRAWKPPTGSTTRWAPAGRVRTTPAVRWRNRCRPSRQRVA